MQISAAYKIRPYPETHPSCLTENELLFIAVLFLKASRGDKCRLTEPDSNPNLSRRVFENWVFVEVI